MNEKWLLYMRGPVPLGLGLAIVTLLARWVTGNTILSSPQTLIQYGIAGSIGYALAGGLAFFFVGWVAKRVRKSYPHAVTLGDVLKEKVQPRYYFPFIGLLLFMGLYALLLQFHAAGILFTYALPVFPLLGFGLFTVIVLYIGGYGGMHKLTLLSFYSVVMIFLTTILLPIYSYLQDGITPIYDGVKLYHPYLFFIGSHETVWFVSAAVVVFTGQILTDRATWMRIFITKPEKIRLALQSTGLIWATVPMALLALLLFALSGKPFDHVYLLIQTMLESLDARFLMLIFVMFCLTAMVTASSSELHGWMSLLIKNVWMDRQLFDQTIQRLRHVVVTGLCLVLFLLVAFVLPTSLSLLFFFGNLYASLIPAFLYIFLADHQTGPAPTAIVSIGTSIGIASHLLMHSFFSIWASFLVACLLFLLFYFFYLQKQNEFLE